MTKLYSNFILQLIADSVYNAETWLKPLCDRPCHFVKGEETKLKQLSNIKKYKNHPSSLLNSESTVPCKNHIHFFSVLGIIDIK